MLPVGKCLMQSQFGWRGWEALLCLCCPALCSDGWMFCRDCVGLRTQRNSLGADGFGELHGVFGGGVKGPPAA